MSATEAELSFADQVGRLFAKSWGLPPVAGRVVGWMMICDPPEQTAADIAEALQASRSAISTVLPILETWGFVRRKRVPGERADRVSFNPSFAEQSIESTTEYAAMLALAQTGLRMLDDAPPGRRDRLLELAAFSGFLLERMPDLAVEWRERRDELRASGELPS